jgi:hypothetical protein
VERGRLKAGDEMSIAHIRYRLDGAPADDATVATVGGCPEPCTQEKHVGNGDRSPEKSENSGAVT